MPEIDGIPIYIPICNCTESPSTHTHSPPQKDHVPTIDIVDIRVNKALVGKIIEQSRGNIGPCQASTFPNKKPSSLPTNE